MQSFSKTYGLIVCGGQSSRMGRDKSMLNYHGQPQVYYLYTLLGTLCDEVFISCNAEQAKSINKIYNLIVDSPVYAGKGPMAGLLSAFDRLPGTDWLVTGCDYPFITRKVVNDFIKEINKLDIAAAFYNTKENIYDPLLAWYSYTAMDEIKKMFAREEYSLQSFLKKKKAAKYYPEDEIILKSIDTLEEYKKIKSSICF
ncbi:MAG: NTP transferase domain-containing protein [Bacteroidetes bacterium]|nr:NTP transferase domain-containing protein [Bacteroidota bacterium]